MKAGPDVEFAPFQQLMNWKIIQAQFSVSFKVLASWVWVIISLDTICPCPLVVFLLFRVKGFFSLFWMGGPSAYFPEILGMLNMVHDCTGECSKALTSQYHGILLQMKISIFRWCVIRMALPVLGNLCTENISMGDNSLWISSDDDVLKIHLWVLTIHSYHLMMF